MNENEVVNVNEVNEDLPVVEGEVVENTGLSTGEKISVGAVMVAAGVGAYHIGKFLFNAGKKGVEKVKGAIDKRKKKEAEVPVEGTEIVDGAGAPDEQ